MYAIMTSGGKQYKVKQGDILNVDRLLVNDGELVPAGQELVLKSVNFIASEGTPPIIGTPMIEGASIKIKVLGEHKAKKVIAFKKVNRNGYHKKQGHRQKYSRIKVIDIVLQ